jgi:magnesium chelatase family protein
MRAEVTRAREIQRRRFEGEASSSRVGPQADTAWIVNAGIPESRFRVYCPMEAEAEELLYAAQKRLRVSARGRSHIVRVARTIADLEGVPVIGSHHVAEAVQYRVRDVPR